MNWRIDVCACVKVGSSGIATLADERCDYAWRYVTFRTTQVKTKLEWFSPNEILRTWYIYDLP